MEQKTNIWLDCSWTASNCCGAFECQALIACETHCVKIVPLEKSLPQTEQVCRRAAYYGLKCAYCLMHKEEIFATKLLTAADLLLMSEAAHLFMHPLFLPKCVTRKKYI